MTIIFSNMLDSDCQVLRCTWQNISDVNIVEITPDMNIDEAETSVNNAIIAEDDTIIFLGHGTEYGLLFPDFYKGLYILHDENVNLIHAKNIICCWCYASSFVNRHNDLLHNTFATSMYISNEHEAYDNAIYDYSQNDIDLNGIRFYANINQLLIDKIPLDQWVMILGAKMDIENEIDVFNRQGLFYQE